MKMDVQHPCNNSTTICSHDRTISPIAAEQFQARAVLHRRVASLHHFAGIEQLSPTQLSARRRARPGIEQPSAASQASALPRHVAGLQRMDQLLFQHSPQFQKSMNTSASRLHTSLNIRVRTYTPNPHSITPDCIAWPLSISALSKPA